MKIDPPNKQSNIPVSLSNEEQAVRFEEAYEAALKFWKGNPKSITDVHQKFTDVLALLPTDTSVVQEKALLMFYYNYTSVLYQSGELSVALAYSDKVLLLLDAEEKPLLYGNTYTTRGAIYLLQGDNKACIEASSIAIEYLNKVDKPFALHPAINNLACAYSEMGEYEKAFGYYYRLLDEHVNSDYEIENYAVFYNFINMIIHLERMDVAKEECAALLVRVEEKQHSEGMIWAYLSYCELYCKTGDFDQVIHYANLANQIILVTGPKYLTLHTNGYLATAYLDLKEYHKGMFYSLALLEDLSISNSVQSVIRAYCLIGHYYFAAPNIVQPFLKYPLLAAFKEDIYNLLKGTEKLIIEQNSHHNKTEIYNLLIKYHRQQREYEEAFYYMDLKHLLLEEFYEIEKNKLIYQLQEEYDSKRLGQEVNYQKKIIDQQQIINNNLKNFAYTASHDIKEPLKLIVGFSDLLKKRIDKTDQEGHQIVDYIIGTSNRMVNLINDILKFATLGNKLPQATSIDLNNILKTAKANLQTAIDEKIACISADQLPIVKGHDTLFIQLFQNLLANAIKFGAEDRSPIIHIYYQKETATHLLTFVDNGIGIPENKLTSIFDTFSRAHTKKKHQGSGIGLASCKKVVELYGGKIWVESEVGKGSQFYIELPFV